MNNLMKLSSMALISAPFVPSQLHAATDQPNVIVIYADDMGSGDLSILNKDAKFKTPNLDALSRSGVTFTDAHTVSSVSTPSRYGILTGEYSWRSSLKAGVIWGHSPALIPEDKPTIATMMKRSGYTTACVGKWHLGWDWATEDGEAAKSDKSNILYQKPISNGPTTRGFDYFYGIPASLDIPPYVTIENENAVNIPDARYEVTAFTGRDNEISENPFLRAGDYVEGESPEDFLAKFTNKVNDLVTEYNAKQDPFFIYFAMTAPHAPIAPSKEFQGKSGIGRYGDFMLEVDHRVGEVVKHLKKEGILENTIIIVSSDNGAEYFNYHRLGECGHNSSAPYKGIKRDLWEGGHRVPLLVSWRGQFKRKIVDDTTVCISDLYATLADITECNMAQGEAQDSYSLMPLITGEGDYQREYTVHHSSGGRFAIRKDGWVLIEGGFGDDNNKLDKIDFYELQGYTFPSEKPQGELFNLGEDLDQRSSLYDQNPEKVAELTAILDRITEGWNTKRDLYKRQ